MESEMEVQAEDRIAAGLIFITANTGVIVSGFIAIFIRRLPLLRNSFGRLLQLQAIGDAIFTAVWGIYFAPTLLFNIKPLQMFSIAARLAQICLICYDISIYSHLIIAINRFISVYTPTHYNSIFTERFTTVLVAGTVLVSFCFSWFLVVVDCQNEFSVKHWMLDYVSPPCNLIYVHYAEFIRGLVVITAFALVNTCTFIRMSFYNRKKSKNAFEAAQNVKRRHAERKFVQQVTSQGFIYVAELTTYFYISKYFPVDADHVTDDPNRWPNFLLTTYAWILVHTLDGVVTLFFNRQFRLLIRRLIVTRSLKNLSKSFSPVSHNADKSTPH